MIGVVVVIRVHKLNL